MTDLIIHVRQFIQSNNLFKKGDQVLVGVSGGVDSMVLLYLLEQLNIKLCVAHCNFKLRGESAERDEAFVKAYCNQHKIPFHTTSFNTKVIADKHKISIQMAARALRYEYFESLRKEKNYHVIAVGTHLNDQLETTLLNLTKGTGIKGLSGISAHQNKVIRPLLLISKNEIEQFAKTNNIPFRVDASNNENKYQRNRIRNEVIPALKKINPAIEASFLDTLKFLKADEYAVKYAVEQTIKEVITSTKTQFYIDTEKLNSCSFVLSVLKSVFEPLGFTYGEIAEVEKLVRSETGKKITGKTYEITKDRSRLVVQPILSALKPILINELPYYNTAIGLSIEKVNKPLFTSKKNIETIDAAKLKLPLTLRPWKKGDKMKPIGMNGKSKLISDILTDAKISASEKPHQLVIENGNGELIWVIGIRVGETFKICETTSFFVKFELKI